MSGVEISGTMKRSRGKEVVKVAGSDISLVGHSDALRQTNCGIAQRIEASRAGIGPLYFFSGAKLWRETWTWL